MQTITFYILPVAAIQNIEQNLPRLAKIYDQIKNNSDNVELTKDFYEPNFNGKTLFDIMNPSNSTEKYIINFFGKFKSSTKIAEINISDYHNQFIEIDNTHGLKKENIIHSINDLINCYQKSAFQLQDFSELFDWKRKCFPDLLFTEDSFGSNHKAFSYCNPSHFDDLYKQTINCLSVLNNLTKELYTLNNDKKINKIHAEVGHVTCTGKGSNEKQKFKKIVFTNNSGQKFKLSCQPHFKLIRSDSDYRIYFSWGDDQIKQNTIIIVKLGSHWNDVSDSALAEIVIT